MRSDDDRSILDARIRVPEHVVYRDFSDETVILNLESGMYHGLNPTAARMLEELERSPSVTAAVDALTAELGQPREVIERDLVAFCHSLEERGLVERHDG
ncbi:MAG TPA: PqqD family protein [Thermoleophilaceae bacterium]|nr:PqqD family protein [Thermoleophilaceae bacterium]